MDGTMSFIASPPCLLIGKQKAGPLGAAEKELPFGGTYQT
jgi:hypothetical protein